MFILADKSTFTEIKPVVFANAVKVLSSETDPVVTKTVAGE